MSHMDDFTNSNAQNGTTTNNSNPIDPLNALNSLNSLNDLVNVGSDDDIAQETFKCFWVDCPHSFKTELLLYHHCCSVHAKEGRQFCQVQPHANRPICNAMCRHKGHLKDHIISHFSHLLKPIKCEACVLGFRNRQDLKKHCKNVHPELLINAALGKKIAVSEKVALLAAEVVEWLNENQPCLTDLSNIAFPLIQNPSAPYVTGTHYEEFLK